MSAATGKCKQCGKPTERRVKKGFLCMRCMLRGAEVAILDTQAGRIIRGKP